MSNAALLAACAVLAVLCLAEFVTMVLVIRKARGQRRLLDAFAQETGRKLGQRKTLRLIRQASTAMLQGGVK